jgi:hypothetical protein
MAKKDDKKLLTTARDRFKKCVEADQENRRKAVEDLKFLHVPGEQWDSALKTERGIRPCYEFNKLRVTIKRIVNDIRANRPVGKVRAVEDGDKDTADTIEGLCRNIWTVSDADCAIDTAAEYSVGGGMGAWRVVTKYSTDDAWDQDIIIEPIRNPLTLWADPASKDPMKRDASFWFLESRMSKEAYEAKYGKKESVDWESSEFDDENEWQDDDTVRVCEYWYRKPVTKKLALLDDGKTVDLAEVDPQSLFTMDPMGQPVSRISRVREVQTHQICMAIIAGDKVLEGPTDWAGAQFPFVVVYGEHLVVDGKVQWFGLTRFAKDAQRAYNFSRTLAIETVAKAPLDTDWATPEQAAGFEMQWARAHKELLPWRLYNSDPRAPGPPVRSQGAQVPVGLVNEMQWSSEDIKATTGIFDNSLGRQANENSGVAIRARQAQAEIATFNYSDNIARGVRRTYEILVDLIPKVYDTERAIRVLGADGAEKYAKVNSVDPQTGKALNDLSRGKYDVAITIGPNMGTQRQEAAEVYMGLMKGNPGLFPIVGDLVVKTFDYPYSDEMAERLRLMAPPQIQQFLAQKEQTGKAPDPQAMAAMAQAEQMMQLVQQQSELVQQAAAEAEGLKSEAQQEVQKIATAAAKLEADFQKKMAALVAKEAQLTLSEAQFTAQQAQAGTDEEGKKVEGERETLSSQLDSAIKELNADMQKQTAEFMTQVAQVLAQIQQSTEKPGKGRKVKMRKVNGGYEADIVEV